MHQAIQELPTNKENTIKRAISPKFPIVTVFFLFFLWKTPPSFGQTISQILFVYDNIEFSLIARSSMVPGEASASYFLTSRKPSSLKLALGGTKREKLASIRMDHLSDARTVTPIQPVKSLGRGGRQQIPRKFVTNRAIVKALGSLKERGISAFPNQFQESAESKERRQQRFVRFIQRSGFFGLFYTMVLNSIIPGANPVVYVLGNFGLIDFCGNLIDLFFNNQKTERHESDTLAIFSGIIGHLVASKVFQFWDKRVADQDEANLKKILSAIELAPTDGGVSRVRIRQKIDHHKFAGIISEILGVAATEHNGLTQMPAIRFHELLEPSETEKYMLLEREP